MDFGFRWGLRLAVAAQAEEVTASAARQGRDSCLKEGRRTKVQARLTPGT